MQNIRITLQGQKINFDQFVAYNDRTRAVGNMQVNARGDVIDSRGEIVEKRTAIMKQKFTGSTVNNKKKGPKTKSPDHRSRARQQMQSIASNNSEQTPLEVTESHQGHQGHNRANRTFSQSERIQPFGPRSTDLRGVLASDIEIDLNEVTRPSDVRTLRRI